MDTAEVHRKEALLCNKKTAEISGKKSAVFCVSTDMNTGKLLLALYTESRQGRFGKYQ